MKKALSVILGIIMIIGILSVGAAAEESEEPVFNYSYKSGDIVDPRLCYIPAQPFRDAGIPFHINLDFYADTDEPIVGEMWSGYYDDYDDRVDLFDGISFCNCNNIESITFGGTGPIIVDVNSAFWNIDISELVLPSNVYAFNCEENGYSYAVQEAKLSHRPLRSNLSYFMFGNCKKLETVTIDNPSEQMMNWAFYDCSSLKFATFTDKAIAISTGMFEGCSSLEKIEISETVKTIKDFAFYNTGLKSIFIPETVTSIEPYAVGYQGVDTENRIGTSLSVVKCYPDRFSISKVECFKIYGVHCSEAERYANENGFEFISADEQPVENKVYSAQVAKQA
ncbi:MAG: leucine-rich repeat domain-containing protein, partial [Clostridia bacterium]|nr:leucine-rich repeat domain-containing protein [Clostridia bacterium]